MANHNPPTGGLTPWKPGQSGNPKGRPRKFKTPEEKKAVEHVQAALWIVAVSNPAQIERRWKNPTYGQMIATKLAARAKGGNTQAMKEWNDRILHRAPQAITNDEGGAFLPEASSNPVAGIPPHILERLLDLLDKQDAEPETDKNEADKKTPPEEKS